MLRLIDRSYGNRAPDEAGNWHSRLDWRGLTVFRDPGDYRGRHRNPSLIENFLGLPAGTYNKMLATLAVLMPRTDDDE